jgi:uncharacterized protein YdaU (DUF1376 family)
MKDPAFLFYHQDFITGTQNMSLAATGAYIKLMCIQASQGHVMLKDMKKICSNICFDTMQVQLDENTFFEVKSKFQETAPGSGLFINQRLAEEIEKRRKYSESRRNNRNSKSSKTHKKDMSTHMSNHMSEHMENENENINRNENRKGGVGEKQKIENSEFLNSEKPQSTEPELITAQELLTDPSNTAWMEQTILMGMRITKPEALKRLTHYSLRCESEGKYFHPHDDIRACRAGFSKWCLTWSDRDRSRPEHKTQSKLINGTIRDEHEEFQKLLINQ